MCVVPEEFDRAIRSLVSSRSREIVSLEDRERELVHARVPAEQVFKCAPPVEDRSGGSSGVST